MISKAAAVIVAAAISLIAKHILAKWIAQFKYQWELQASNDLRIKAEKEYQLLCDDVVRIERDLS